MGSRWVIHAWPGRPARLLKRIETKLSLASQSSQTAGSAGEYNGRLLRAGIAVAPTAFATAHGEATGVKLGGFSAPTRDVSGARPYRRFGVGPGRYFGVGPGAYECFGYDCNW